ncbi:MAG: response regulator transcription factor [Clostridiales bacterium]|nr:response regulator transcription factor [Clostridiales bacterium]
MPRIFFVEDDENIRSLVIYALATAEMAPCGFEDGQEFFKALKKGSPDLVMLDIMMPGEDGVSILKRLKQNQSTCEIPVIMLTAKGSEFDRVKGLDLGADDYIVKPFSMLELIARIRAVLRRSGADPAESSVLSYENITMDTDRYAVKVDGEAVELTYKEFELLLYMLRNHDIVLSRDKMMTNVWGFDYEGESRTVDMHIKTLRQKLKSASKWIKTVRSIGYKLGK